jgi:hypothetical protein
MRQTDIDTEITPFDKANAYRNHVAPLIAEMVKQCTIHGIPMFVTCCIANDEHGSEYKSDAVTPDSHGLNLADDNIQKHICLKLGFDTVYHCDPDFDFDSIEKGTEE